MSGEKTAADNLAALKVARKKLGGIDLTKKFKEYTKAKVSTGVKAFDIVTNGGIPCGKLTEISGGPSSWKSLIVMMILAETQKMGGLAIYADVERSLEQGLAELTDVNVSDLIYLNPDQIVSVEDVFKALEKAMNIAKETSQLVTFVWDSVAATPGKEDLEKDIGRNEASMRRAKLIGDALKKFIPQVYQTNVGLVFVNQLRDRIGVMYGDQQDTPGGHAIKFWSSLRLSLRFAGKIKDKNSGEQVGGKGVLTVKKTKVGVPFGEVHFETFVSEPLNYYTGLMDYYQRHGIITKGSKNTTYQFKDMKDEFEKIDFISAYEQWEKKNK